MSLTAGVLDRGRRGLPQWCLPGGLERVAVVAVLSEREERALLETEAYLRAFDEEFVRSFEALAQGDPPAHPEVTASRADRPAERRRLPLHDHVLRALFVLSILVMLAVCGWVFHEGDSQIQLLTALVMLPVLALVAFTVVVLSLEDGR